MAISSRQGLIDYCFRRLGFPVIEINVDDDQVSDRIDDALQYFQEYHFDGVERIYLKHQITGNTVKISGFTANSFEVGETITGSSSGASAKISEISSSNTIITDRTSGTWTASETITGDVTGTTATLASTAFYTAGDMDNEYIEVNDNILGVTSMFSFAGAGDGSENPNNIFNLLYQFRQNDMWNLLNTDLIYYTQVKTHMQMFDQIFPGKRSIRFNRKMNKIFIDVNWEEVFDAGDYLIFDCYRILDPATYTEIYDDMFLKRYATALIKRQWGENMKKFGGIQLPGGVTLNGMELYQEANQELTQIEEEMQSKHELPVNFFVG